MRKKRIYAGAGVRHFWLIDPIVRTLEVFRLQVSLWVCVDTYCDDAVVRAEPFDAIEIMLDDRWSESEECSESEG